MAVTGVATIAYGAITGYVIQRVGLALLFGWLDVQGCINLHDYLHR